ncbi:hypothetical protein BGX31_007681 [Mortierella sp. GBA43]|nr:hypothetical protein BGX31_007681 [Mortierella sp. GBA43]
MVSGSKIDHQWFCSLLPEVQSHVRSSVNLHRLFAQAILDGHVEQSDRLGELLTTSFQELKKPTAILSELQMEMEAQQIQVLDQLVQLQRQAQSIASLSLDPYRSFVPRLFIVLPHNGQPWSSTDLHSNKFQIHFLCECEEPASSRNRNISHHIHLAHHEGYDIQQSKDFFQKYGSYVLTILKMFKFGVSGTGLTVPALHLLVNKDATVRGTVRTLTNNIRTGMDRVISYIEKILNGQSEHEGLETLETFLIGKGSDKTLGDLYRIVNTENHVKWLCIDHYREVHHENGAKTIRDSVHLAGGTFDEHVGRVDVTLDSNVQAERFYAALDKSKAVYGLRLGVDLDQTQSNFTRLRNALVKTNIGVLELDLSYRDGPESDTPYRYHRHNAILDIMRHPNIQSFSIIGSSWDFVERSTLSSHKSDFLNLRHLDIDIGRLCLDIPGLKLLVAKSPNLSSLVLDKSHNLFIRVYNALVEYQAYPITFRDRPLRILPPTDKSSQPMDGIRDMGHLLEVHGARIEVLILYPSEMDDLATMEAFSRAIEDGSRLQELTVRYTCTDDVCIQHLTNIVSKSKLYKFDVDVEGERVEILESIQWEHIRELAVRMGHESTGTSVMTAIIAGAAGVSEIFNLKDFSLHAFSYETMSRNFEELLQSFVNSTPLRSLQVDVTMTFKQVQDLVTSVDVSQLQHLNLWSGNLDSTQVESILNSLREARALQTICLRWARITEKQKKWMKTQGIALTDGN